jgi:glycosyltransferase involved in cell wall biosynthesis
MQEKKKIKILTLSDDPRFLSGVAIQTRYFIEGLLKTGRFSFICLGGLIKHQDKRPVMIDEWGEDWRIIPVDGFGDANLVRSVIMAEKPDMLWVMTDPRYWDWLWNVENEIRQFCPIVYYHVWDNYPAPKYNKKWYDSNDVIVSISKLTEDVVQQLADSKVDQFYIPHTVDSSKFFLHPNRLTLRKEIIDRAKLEQDCFLLFYNSRNIRRKQIQTLFCWVGEYNKNHPEQKVRLLAKTDPRDPHGCDLVKIVEDFELNDQVRIIGDRLPPDKLNELYNVADATVLISDAEGFGVAVLESLFAGTPVITTKTGGMVDQYEDGVHGYAIDVDHTIVGAQETPYIYEDRTTFERFEKAINDCFLSRQNNVWGTKEHREMCANHALTNFNMEKYVEEWVKVIDFTYEKYGSWETRKHYKQYQLFEV